MNKEEEIKEVLKQAKNKNSEACITIRAWQYEVPPNEYVIVKIVAHSKIKKIGAFGQTLYGFFIDSITYKQSISPYTGFFIFIDIFLFTRMFPNLERIEVTIYDSKNKVIYENERILANFNN